MTARPPQATHARIDAIWRIESARVIATIARMCGTSAAPRTWPRVRRRSARALAVHRRSAESRGVADRDREAPGDRSHATLQDKYAQIVRELGVSSEERDLDAELDDDIGDDLRSTRSRALAATRRPVAPRSSSPG